MTQLSINGLALLLALVTLWGASRGPPARGVYPMRLPRSGPRTARQALGHAWRRAWPCVTPAIVTL
jgi:hypothetical protein